jgi:2,3-dihydro-2,3-dihydroxybenzoate dehydrogenase
MPMVGIPAYAASKAALSHFAKCVSLEVACKGIRVNVLSPGKGGNHQVLQLLLPESQLLLNAVCNCQSMIIDANRKAK